MSHTKYLWACALFASVLLVGGAGSVFGEGSDAPGPEVSLSLRGLSNQSVEVGVPLLASLRIDGPSDGASAPLVIAPTHGTWADLVTVELITNDETVLATARAASLPEESGVTLDADHYVAALWLFSPEALAAAGTGSFQVRARFEVRDGNGWKGQSFSTPTVVRIVGPSDSSERKVQNASARAQAAIIERRLKEAAQILDTILALEPDHVPLLKLRALVCLYGGDVASAQRCVRRARVLLSQGEGHPSVELHELALLIDEAAASAGGSLQPESWTPPPASVAAPLRFPARESDAASSARAANTSSPVPADPAAAVEPNTATAVAASVAPSLGAIIPAAELADAGILSESTGQWAASAVASSQYGKKQYSASQATGAPNISVAGNSPDAWSPAKKNDGTEWLEVTFAKPGPATEVRIRQNDTPGCISRVEAIEPDGTAHLWWEGADPYVVPATREITWFAVRVPKTAYPVAKVKITLNLATVPGWKEVDAVQLVGSPE